MCCLPRGVQLGPNWHCKMGKIRAKNPEKARTTQFACATLQEPLWAISAVKNNYETADWENIKASLMKINWPDVLDKEYRVRQDLNQEPPMGVISVLKHMSTIKKQRLVLAKEYRVKQDLF